MADEPVYFCPVDVPLHHLGGKWKLIICFFLLQRPCRNGELRRLIPEVRQKMLALGAEPAGNSPAQFASFIRDDMAKWAKLMAERGIHPE